MHLLFKRQLWLLLVQCCLIGMPAAHAQRHQKREAAIEESAKPHGISGGVKFQVSKPVDVVYESALTFLKRADYAIDSADKEAGQIITAMTISGGYSQTGRRVYVILIKDSDTTTTLRVAVTDQKRKKLLQTEPWSDPKVNEKESDKIASDLKGSL